MLNNHINFLKIKKIINKKKSQNYIFSLQWNLFKFSICFMK